MHHQHRHGDLLEVFGIIFEPRVDGCAMSEGTAGHTLAPPVRNDRFGRLRPIQVVAVEWILRDETVELRPVAQHARPDRFEPLRRLPRRVVVAPRLKSMAERSVYVEEMPLFIGFFAAARLAIPA